MEEPSDIQKLLRLKRYERPAPGHTESFLREFQRRQRNELLRRPLWKLALERFQVFLRECGLGNLAYAGATAGLLVFAAGTMVELSHQRQSVAVTAPAAAEAMAAKQLISAAHLALDTRAEPFLLSPGPDAFEVSTVADVSRPRYVIDARPASYEPPASF